MENISLYLEKFKSLGLKEKKYKEIVVQAIKNVCGSKINEKDVSHNDGEVVIKVSGPKKAAIFLYKEKIIKEIKKLSEEDIFDIK